MALIGFSSFIAATGSHQVFDDYLEEFAVEAGGFFGFFERLGGYVDGFAVLVEAQGEIAEHALGGFACGAEQSAEESRSGWLLDDAGETHAEHRIVAVGVDDFDFGVVERLADLHPGAVEVDAQGEEGAGAGGFDDVGLAGAFDGAGEQAGGGSLVDVVAVGEVLGNGGEDLLFPVRIVRNLGPFDVQRRGLDARALQLPHDDFRRAGMQAGFDHNAVFLPDFGCVGGFEPGGFHDSVAGVGGVEFEIEFAPEIAHQRPDLGRSRVDHDPAAVAECLDDDALAAAGFDGLGQWDGVVESRPGSERCFGNDVERVDGVAVELRRDFHRRHDLGVAVGLLLGADAENAIAAADSQKTLAALVLFAATAEG